MNTDLKHYLYFSASQAGKIVGSILATAILARYLDPTGLGRWTMLLATATFLHASFANWLQQDPFLRFGKQDWIEHGNLHHTWGYRLPLLASGILLSVIGVSAFWSQIQSALHVTFWDLVLIYGYFISLIISIDTQTVLQITGRMDRLALAPMLISIASVPLYLALWHSHLPGHHVEISLLGTILLTVTIWIAVGRSEFIKTQWPSWRWAPSKVKTYLAYAWPILPTALLGYLMNWGNQVLIHRSFSNYEVGLYQSAFQVHNLGVTLALPFTTILMPRLLDRHLQDPTAMKRFVQTIAPALFSLWLLVVIPGISILPFIFLKIYGYSYAAGIYPLTALLAATPFCAIGQIYTGLFTVQGKLASVFWVILTMVVVNFVGAWVIVPHAGIGLRSIAIAFGVAFILAQCLVYYIQHRFLKVSGWTMHGLVGVTLIFSIGESILFPTHLRIIWSALMWLCLIALIRQWGIIDAALLKQLFSGRLAAPGKWLEKILIIQRKELA